jgi:hypothetical protein
MGRVEGNKKSRLGGMLDPVIGEMVWVRHRTGEYCPWLALRPKFRQLPDSERLARSRFVPKSFI